MNSDFKSNLSYITLGPRYNNVFFKMYSINYCSERIFIQWINDY